MPKSLSSRTSGSQLDSAVAIFSLVTQLSSRQSELCPVLSHSACHEPQNHTHWVSSSFQHLPCQGTMCPKLEHQEGLLTAPHHGGVQRKGRECPFVLFYLLLSSSERSPHLRSSSHLGTLLSSFPTARPLNNTKNACLVAH